MFHSSSPKATGKGALGLNFGEQETCSLFFMPEIQQWEGNNLLLTAIYCRQPGLECSVEIKHRDAASLRRSYLLQSGWNKLEIDLVGAERTETIADVIQVAYHFSTAARRQVWLDDIILLRHRKVLLGVPAGRARQMYAVQEGRRFRIGSAHRFELVFYNGLIVGWYDLARDAVRVNNLAPRGGLGPFIFAVLHDGQREVLGAEQRTVSIGTRIASRKRVNMIRLDAELFFDGRDPTHHPPDVKYTYTISADGQVDFLCCLNTQAKKLSCQFALACDEGFDPVIGKMRNPSAPDDTRIEYALLRRMGTQGGSDLLIAFRPWKASYLPVACRVAPAGAERALHITFESDAQMGQNCLAAMMRFWPDDIDHLGNAERYVRAFVTRSPTALPWPESDRTLWSPSWTVQEKEAPDGSP